jgi:Flp pilus assembly protein TadD
MFGRKQRTPQPPLSQAERCAREAEHALEEGNAERALELFRLAVECAPLDRNLREGLRYALHQRAEQSRLAAESRASRKRPRTVIIPQEFALEEEEQPAPHPPTGRKGKSNSSNPGFAASDVPATPRSRERQQPERQQPRNARKASSWASEHPDEFDDPDDAALGSALGSFAEEFKPAPERRHPSTPGRRRVSHRPQNTHFSPLAWLGGITLTCLILGATAFAYQGILTFMEEVALPKSQYSTGTQQQIPEALNNIILEASEDLTNRKSADAVSSLDKAWKKYPEHQDSIRPVLVSALRVQGTRLINSAKYEEALKLFERATELEPQNENNWIELARSYREYARREQPGNSTRSEVLFTRAQEAYTKALELDKNNPSALFGLGQVYSFQDNRAEAVEKYKRVVALAPGTPEARQAREFLQQLIGS